MALPGRVRTQPEDVRGHGKTSQIRCVRKTEEKLTGWRLDGDGIKKEYQFLSFPQAIKFVNKVAEISEQADHHPDILISFRKVTLSLSTHDEGGITQKDFGLAGPGYRIYFGKDGDRLVILIGGGTKKRQQQDIASAQECWAAYKRRKKQEIQ